MLTVPYLFISSLLEALLLKHKTIDYSSFDVIAAKYLIQKMTNYNQALLSYVSYITYT